MNAQASTIVDPQQAYPPEPVVIDRPTDDLVDFVAACQELRRRGLDERDAQLTQATRQLADQLAATGRSVSGAVLLEAAAWQVFYQRRGLADRELAGMHSPSRLLQEADQHDDTVLYRRREQALTLLLSDEADSYVHLVPEVLADRERACRQQALLVDDQEQLNRQLGQLRWVRGLISLRRVRQLHAELAELDRQLEQAQGEIRHQQALLDVIHASDTNRQAWLAEHQATLHQGAAAVLVLTRRFLALANPPGCNRPVAEVDLDQPMGRDPLAPPATNGGAAPGPAGEDTRVVSSAMARAAASPAQPPGHG
jgi:hypothetical protein